MRLGTVLRKYRAMAEVPVRDLAQEMGISAPALSRIENGKAMDIQTFMKILEWLTSEDAGKEV